CVEHVDGATTDVVRVEAAGQCHHPALARLHGGPVYADGDGAVVVLHQDRTDGRRVRRGVVPAFASRHCVVAARRRPGPEVFRIRVRVGDVDGRVVAATFALAD